MSISRDMERPKRCGEQLELFVASTPSHGHGTNGAGGTQSGVHEVSQVPSAAEEQRALTQDLMERVASLVNLERAVRKVRSNKGCPGADGMTIRELNVLFPLHWQELREQLLSGLYHPTQVLGVEIPKPNGGVRQLGIPTVLDRVVQQALLQCLTPRFDPTFSDSSFGFRPGRSAHDALAQARGYVKRGRSIVVDVDLERFFDRVNHDVLMSRVARRIGDKRVLKLIRRFLEAGMMQDGVCIERYEGTPQGGPLSPLLANLLLDDFDSFLNGWVLYFRYADCKSRLQGLGE